MADPDFGQRETELRRALASNKSLLVLLFAGLVLIGALGYALDHAARWLHQRWMH